ncbi:MAG: DUF4856 domain-containing protein, partial [Bdellovibrionales bacterium]|nr:DUF4856 domain-containing protein [Bdellovibrionales bacterium]NQZ19941.1 DUF4856 domain-containing protein [Bdellovibrionales bacterium]
MKKTSVMLSALLLAGSASAQLQPMTLKQAKELVSQPTAAIEASLDNAGHIYQYNNDEGQSSVSYTGQNLRQVLINDTKLIIGSMRRGEFEGNQARAFNTLNSIYEYSVDGIKVSDKAINGSTPLLVSAKDTQGNTAAILEFFYLDVLESSKNLRTKMAGEDNALRNGKLLGWETMTVAGQNFDEDNNGSLTPDELMRGYMNVVAANAASSEKTFTVPDGMGGVQELNGAYLTPEGLDIAQMAQKFLHGAVSLSQAAGDYMSIDLKPGKGLNASNVRQPGKAYTALEHHWDEAFGYWGAARNYTELTVLEIRRGFSLDSFDEGSYMGPNQGDGEISILTEKNMGLSTNAAKRDLGAAGQDTNFTRDSMDFFLKGRHLIADQPEGYLNYVQAYSLLALDQWEKVIAATAIHYVNSSIADLEAYGTADYSFKALAKHWGEMKGFALTFQFNPYSSVSVDDFKTMHALMKDAPVLPNQDGVEQYIQDLYKARD